MENSPHLTHLCGYQSYVLLICVTSSINPQISLRYHKFDYHVDWYQSVTIVALKYFALVVLVIQNRKSGRKPTGWGNADKNVINASYDDIALRRHDSSVV
jgi:hypothetical protein